MARNKEQKEAEQKEEQRIKEVHENHALYAKRIEARIAKGENKERDEKGLKLLEVQPYEEWVKKAKRKDKDGNEIEIEVSGDSGETGKERFKRLIDKRMTVALNDLDLIMNLSSPQYEPYDVDKILNALRLKVLDIENSFKSQKKEETFSL